MARFVGAPLRGVEFANVGDEAVSARIAGDSVARIRIDAGGRLTWSGGNATGDVVLYRSAVDTLKTDDTLYAANGIVTLTTNGVPDQNLPDGAMAIDVSDDRLYLRSGGVWVKAGSASVELATTAPTENVSDGDMWFDTDDGILYVRTGGQWVSATGAIDLNSLSDVSAASPSDGQVLQYNASTAQWEAATFTALPAGGETGQVLTKVDGTDYNYSWQDVVSADGGVPSTWLRVHVSIDAGGV